MPTLLTLTLAIVMMVAVAAGAPTDDAAGIRFLGHSSTNGVSYYISNRLLKQGEGYSECKQFGYELVSISSPEETKAIKDFLIPYEFAGLWTAGVTDSWSRQNYLWQTTDTEIVYFNWAEGQPTENLDQLNWQDSGIALIKNSNWRWELEHEQKLHQALCQSIEPC